MSESRELSRALTTRKAPETRHDQEWTSQTSGRSRDAGVWLAGWTGGLSRLWWIDRETSRVEGVVVTATIARRSLDRSPSSNTRRSRAETCTRNPSSTTIPSVPVQPPGCLAPPPSPPPRLITSRSMDALSNLNFTTSGALIELVDSALFPPFSCPSPRLNRTDPVLPHAQRRSSFTSATTVNSSVC